MSRSADALDAVLRRGVGVPPGAQVRQYALAFALAKYGTMAGPGQIAANIEVVDLAIGTQSDLVRH